MSQNSALTSELSSMLIEDVPSLYYDRKQGLIEEVTGLGYVPRVDVILSLSTFNFMFSIS